MKKKVFALLFTLFAIFIFVVACTDGGDVSSDDNSIDSVNSVDSVDSIDSIDSVDSADSDESVEYVTVTFDSDGGTQVQSITVKRGETIICPDVVSLRSTLENPIVFVGWYLGDDEWDFSDGVTEDITLVAHWKQDGRYTELVIPEK